MSVREDRSDERWTAGRSRATRRGLVIGLVAMGCVAVAVEVRGGRDGTQGGFARARAVLGGALVDSEFIARRIRSFELSAVPEAQSRVAAVEATGTESLEPAPGGPLVGSSASTVADGQVGLDTDATAPSSPPKLESETAAGASPKPRDAARSRREANDAAAEVARSSTNPGPGDRSASGTAEVARSSTNPGPGEPSGAVTPDVALAEANALADRGRWAEARAAFDRALAQQPGNPSALLGRARCRSEQGDSGGALKDLETLLKGAPRNPQALLMAGSVAQDLGRLEDARRFYRRYLDAWPDGRKASEVRKILTRL